jgi:hypothetical protein
VLCEEHQLACNKKESGRSHRKCPKLKRIVKVVGCSGKRHDCPALEVVPGFGEGT